MLHRSVRTYAEKGGDQYEMHTSRSRSVLSRVNRNSSYPHYITVLNLADIEFPMI